jgi:protein O-GlcNAc transferase
MTTVSPPQTEINSVIALYSNGQIQEALGAVGALIKDYPNEVLLYNISGICYKTIGKLDEAVKSFEKALAIKPNYAEVHYNLGVTFQELGQLDAAVKSYELALNIKPDYANACNNLGFILQGLGQLDAAVELYEKAITIKPDFADACNNLGITLRKLGQLDAAVKSYEKALAIKPDYAEAFNNLGNTLQDLGQLDAAVKSFEKAIAIKPGYAEAFNNLGNTLRDLNQLDTAIKCYEKAVTLKPDYAEPNYNHGNILFNLKRLDEALASYERAFAKNPEVDFLLGSLLQTKMDLCIWNDLPNNLNELTKKINNNEKVINPFPLLALIDDPELQRKTAEIYVNDAFPKNHDLPEIGLYPKHKKIRIGYFSADFYNHPVSALTAELYEVHDRNQFEIHAFSYGPDTKDKMNLRIKAGVDYFHEVRTMSHKDIAMLARSLEIDIAVDLGGFTQDARTGIFAMSAAPIQASYIGYLGTLGVSYYDYLVADQTLIPEQNQKYFTEKIVYLPCFQANDSTQSLPDITFTREDLGLPEEGFIFCCFNNTYKFTPTTFDSWGRILKSVEGSVLLIYADNESAQINLTKEITARGIDSNRLIFGKHLSKSKYLARYQVVDLFLDTQPYNAGTTASDALRMGLPVLTLKGNSFASRVAAGVISALNLPELITTTEEEYESLAIELATHPEKLKIIKDKLVSNLSTAPLYDTKLFTKNLESAYTMIYERHHQGLEPDHIYVKH